MTNEEIIEEIKHKTKWTVIGYPSSQGFKKPFHPVERITLFLGNDPTTINGAKSFKADSFEDAIAVLNHFKLEMGEPEVVSEAFKVDKAKDIYILVDFS